MKTLSASVLALVAVVVFTSGAGAVPLPTWDKVINGKARFKVLSQFGGAAVLDKETGLVWEQAPDSESDPADRKTWGEAQFHCNNRAVGGRKGWRLPTVQELTSLVDPNNPVGGDPALPPDHPFSNVRADAYWSATLYAVDPAGGAWTLGFFDGLVFIFDKANTFFVWCVRAGSGGPDAQ